MKSNKQTGLLFAYVKQVFKANQGGGVGGGGGGCEGSHLFSS